MKKKNEGTLLDKLHEVRIKHNFMTEAITELWGNEDSVYGDDTVFGCHLLMYDISDELEGILEALEKAETASTSKNLKLVRKGA